MNKNRDDSLNNHNLEIKKLAVEIYVEVKPQLRVAHLILNFPPPLELIQEGDNADLEINLSETFLEVKDHKKGQEYKLELDGIAFILPSCHGLKWIGKDELHFRLQLLPNTSLLTKDGTNDDMDITSKIEGKKVCCECKMCGQEIIENKRFQRVLLLPSDSWTEMTEFWFCHKHSDESNCDHQLTNGFEPKESDFYIGDLQFLVHRNVVDISMVHDKIDECVRCKRCNYILGKYFKGQFKHGTNNSKSVSLNFDAVSLRDVFCPENSFHNIEHKMADIFLQHSKSTNSLRFLIETQKNGLKLEPYLQLWLIDSNSYVYTASSKSNENKSYGFPVLKFLYKDCSRQKSSSEALSWRKDMAVQVLELSQDLCQSLIKMLIGSSKLMPKSLRYQSGFFVGFIRRH